MDKELIRILLVEDDPDYRRTVKTVLTESSRVVYYHIKTVSNTAQAVKCLSNPNTPGFDVIVLDLGLLDSSNTGSIKRLRRLCSRTPIIALTEQRDEELGLQAIKHGADDYFAKDDALKGILTRAIRHTIERRKITEQLRRAKLRAEQLKTETEHVNHQLKTAVKAANLMAKEAIRVEQSKSQFLADMSHEIRVPMNAIIGFSQVLADEDITDQQKEFVRIIRDSGESLLHLIDDILDFSKIEAGKIYIEIADCSLKKVLKRVESMMRFHVEEKGLEFKIVKSDGLPARIRTDSIRLRQCLINLVGNAVKFTKKGHVYLNVSLEQDDDKSFVRFDVEDTGAGIPAERQKAIFESFIQADRSIGRTFGGAGLGLTITKRLSELLGGTLELASEVGKGSVFTLRIPTGIDTHQLSTCRQDDTDGGYADEQQPRELRFSGRILVVEDIPTNRKLLTLLLEKMGFEVSIAEDGQRAVDKAHAESFDLILMDMQIPHINGYEATRLLRQQGTTTPIVAVTAHAMKGDDERCIEAGCDGYLSKPIDRDKLIAVIRKCLSARKMISSSHPE